MSINSNLPAIELPFELENGDVIPKIWAVVDTSAGCTCGNSLFFGTFGICFPHVIHSIVVASEAGYSPLTLAGIVAEDVTSTTKTDLPIALTYKTPFRNVDNTKVLYTIAVGPKVDVNFLLVLSFFKATKATIDLEANILC